MSIPAVRYCRGESYVFMQMFSALLLASVTISEITHKFYRSKVTPARIQSMSLRVSSRVSALHPSLWLVGTGEAGENWFNLSVHGIKDITYLTINRSALPGLAVTQVDFHYHL